jgi:hypothetical protein
VSQVLHDARVLGESVIGSGGKGRQPQQIFRLDAQRAGDDAGLVLEEVLNPVGFGRTIASMHCSNFLLTCEGVSGLCSYRKIAET